MKKTLLFLLSIFTINFNLIIVFDLSFETPTFLKEMTNSRFYDYQTKQGMVIYDEHQNRFYQTNLNGKICINSWKDSDLRIYMIDNKVYLWYLQDNQYYYQVDNQEFIWDINDDTLQFKIKPIIDLNLNYQPIKTECCWNGTLYDNDKREKFISKLSISDYLLCKSYATLITKLITSFHAKASLTSCEEFDWFINQKTFFSFKQLVNVINQHNLNYSSSHYIDVPLEKIASKVKDRKGFEEIMLLLYNTLSYFFGKNQGYKILRALTVDPNCGVEGVTNHIGKNRAIAIKLNVSALNPNKANRYWNWLTGFTTTYHPYGVIAHEFGHLIDLYHLKSFKQRVNVDNCSGLDNQLSNHIKQDKICPLIKSGFNFCGWQFDYWFNQFSFQQLNQEKDVNFINNENDQETLDYCIIQTIALVQCILSNIENFELPKIQEEQINLIFKILPYIFINSDYGRTNFFELQSEGFEYWLLTPQQYRTKAWEIWNQFFLNYLPTLRSKNVKHYNWLGLKPLATYLYYFKNNAIAVNL